MPYGCRVLLHTWRQKMNWQEFNDTVRTFLLVDSERKGKGVQNYIDRMIVALQADRAMPIQPSLINEVIHS